MRFFEHRILMNKLISLFEIRHRQYPEITLHAMEMQPQTQTQPQPQLPVAIQIAAGQSGDDRYTQAPKPERHWITTPDIPTTAEIYGKLPRIPTRGIPETYQSMGIIKTDDGQILPLYGRRTTSRSDRFQYYTRTDTYNPVQLPIQHKRRDCQDDIGCDELRGGESIKVAGLGKEGHVEVYKYDGPKYIPGLV